MLNHFIAKLPVVVLSPQNRCNCRCVMCDIWKETEQRKLDRGRLTRLIDEFTHLGVEWVVFSGGEPLLYRPLFELCAELRSRSIRTTLLTTGLLIERYAGSIADWFDDAIVSLDGPPPVHDLIRHLPGASRAIERGIHQLLARKPSFSITARCTVQKANHQHLNETASTAHEWGLARISFLAADLKSTAFNRPDGWSSEREADIALAHDQLPPLAGEIEQLIDRWCPTGFVSETPEKLRKLVLHFQAHLDLAEPIAPRCNAPWVSAVVDSDGAVRPCFFHPPVGNLHANSLQQIVNGPAALVFRSQLNIAQNSICRRCVCSLHR